MAELGLPAVGGGMNYGSSSVSALIAMFILLAGCKPHSINYHVFPYSISVIDASSLAPIDGAIVVSIFTARGGTHGSSMGVIHYQEGITDEHGIARMPGWSPRGLKKGFDYYEPRVIVYKDGYGVEWSLTESKRERVEGIIYVTEMRAPYGIRLTPCGVKADNLRQECIDQARRYMATQISSLVDEKSRLLKGLLAGLEGK